jgi:actin-related protein 6
MTPYQSALSLTSSEIYLSTYPVTRAEYLEHGSSICRRRFGGPAYNINPPGMLSTGDGGGADLSDDERERRYAMGLESIKGKGSGKVKGKRKGEDEEVTSGNWGGRRRRGLV